MTISFPRSIPPPSTFPRRAAAVAIALAALAVALPGADRLGQAAPPWASLGDPLGGTWLALMALLGGGGALLLRHVQARVMLVVAVGMTATWLTAQALGGGVNNGRFDASGALGVALAGPVGGRMLLFASVVMAMAAFVWAVGPGVTKRDRVIGSSVGLVMVGVTLMAGHLGYGESMGTAPLLALLEASLEGQVVGDRLAAVSVCVGVLVTGGLVAVHAAFGARTSAEVGLWMGWVCLVLLPLVCVALFSVASEQWSVGAEALKYALLLAAAILSAGTGVGLALRRGRRT